MQLVRRGDARAFEVIYERHSGAAFSLAYRMVGTRGVAEDVDAGGVPVAVALGRALRPRARLGAHLGARDRPPPRDRRAAPRAPCTTRAARATRASRSASRRASAPTSRRPAARRPATVRGALDVAARRPVAGDRARLLRRLHAHGDRRDARRAGRHREGPDAARAGEDARRSSEQGRWPGMSDHARWADTAGAYVLGAHARRRARRASRPTSTDCAACREEVDELRAGRRRAADGRRRRWRRRRRSRSASWPRSSARPRCSRAAGRGRRPPAERAPRERRAARLAQRLAARAGRRRRC